MFSYPEFVLQHTADRQRELRAAADQYRLLAAARWARKQRRTATKSGGRHRRPAAVSDQVGTLAAWAASGEPAR